MGNLRKHISKLLFLATAAQTSMIAQADSHRALAERSFPYLGERSVPCNIKPPAQELAALDAGFYADENCRTVYVLPPQLGTLRISPPAFLDTSYCPVVKDTKDLIAETYKDLTGNLQERQKRINQVVELKHGLDSIGRNEAFSQFSFTASLDWQKLIEGYQAANPDKDVIQMPIVYGLLSANVTSDDIQDTDGKNRALLNLKILAPSLKPNSEQGSMETGTVDNQIKKVAAGLDVTGSYLFGGSVAGQMQLRLQGTCGLFDNDGTLKSDPKSFFTGTYTYFFPIQTSSYYTIKLDRDGFEQAIMNILERNNGQISSAEINSAIIKTPILQILKNDGMGDVGEADKLEQQYKEQLMQVIATSVVSTIADRISVAVNRATYTESRTDAKWGCSGDWPFTHCGNEYFTVSVKKINWSLVDTQLSNLLGVQDPKISKYRTIYRLGTSAFANVGQ